MEAPLTPTLFRRLKTLIIGGARDPHDPHIFHHISLIAFFAWIGLGADGLSSSSYGPEEAFRALGGFGNLAIFIALATAFTVLVISASYSQIIELFPHGGGGYVVASKLLSPKAGMVAGAALLIDYVMTITVSIASGADAVFSFLPAPWLKYKLAVAVAGVLILTVLNLRGVKESVVPLIPIFLTFIITHLIAIAYAIVTHLGSVPDVASQTAAEVRTVTSQLGVMGMLLLLMHSYSMGAGTYTGIEAVSNGLPILREPKVQTGKRTMRYMAVSLALMVLGLMLAYLLFQVQPSATKTLNAVLLENMTRGWGDAGYLFLLVTLVSEAALLFVAAQTGFLGGPRVLANMALDRWLPTKFAMLSDRLVTQNGVLLMGGAALVTMLATGGSVRFLVVLYSINVFITFVLSQLGMVRHWWNERGKPTPWRKKLAINGIGLVLTAFILVSVTVVKFNEGGWITLFVTAGLIAIVSLIHRHYGKTHALLGRLDALVAAATQDPELADVQAGKAIPRTACDPKANTAVLLVNGFNGLGLHTLFGVIRLFQGVFKNFVFVQVGVIDAGVFKGREELDELREQVARDAKRYTDYMHRHGFAAEAVTAVGTDVVDEVAEIAQQVLTKFPKAVFFGGQLVFPEETFLTRWLHNYIVFSIQRRFYHRGMPFVILPIRV
jgi:amino acid transporter